MLVPAKLEKRDMVVRSLAFGLELESWSSRGGVDAMDGNFTCLER